VKSNLENALPYNNIPLQSYYFYKPHIFNDEHFYDDVRSDVKCLSTLNSILYIQFNVCHGFSKLY